MPSNSTLQVIPLERPVSLKEVTQEEEKERSKEEPAAI